MTEGTLMTTIVIVATDTNTAATLKLIEANENVHIVSVGVNEISKTTKTPNTDRAISVPVWLDI